jgi:hypothetical protein
MGHWAFEYEKFYGPGYKVPIKASKKPMSMKRELDI